MPSSTNSKKEETWVRVNSRSMLRGPLMNARRSPAAVIRFWAEMKLCSPLQSTKCEDAEVKDDSLRRPLDLGKGLLELTNGSHVELAFEHDDCPGTIVESGGGKDHLGLTLCPSCGGM